MTDSEEVWQGYHENGEPADEITKDEAAKGKLHAASHLWLWRKARGGIEILLQRRAADKRTWPGYYDISTAGHIDFGETPLAACLRELKEELGISLAPNRVRLLFVYRQNIVAENSGIVENEFQFVYGFEVTSDLKTDFEDSEVELVKWVTLAEFEALVSGQSTDKLVPQGRPYFSNLTSEVRRLANENH